MFWINVLEAPGPGPRRAVLEQGIHHDIRDAEAEAVECRTWYDYTIEVAEEGDRLQSVRLGDTPIFVEKPQVKVVVFDLDKIEADCEAERRHEDSCRHPGCDMTAIELHTSTTLRLAGEISKAVADGALFVVNHSGGKDSQALYAVISAIVPHEQIAVVHADLGDEVEHLGVLAHIHANVTHQVHIAKAVWKDGQRKTLLDAIERRGMWPSAPARYCTSDLKRGPCEKVIRRLSKETGRKIVVSCFGFRAEESATRAKRPAWSKSERNSKGGRDWYEFSPLHDVSTMDVFRIIASAGQKPHPVYATGNERLSCVFCVLGSANDLANGARLRPQAL